MASQDREKKIAAMWARTLPITSTQAEFTAQKRASRQAKSLAFLTFLTFLFALPLLITTGRSSGAAELPSAMHSPQGALDVAAALPGKYGLLAKRDKPMAPGEAAVSSVKAIAGLMKQAIDVAAMLPKDPQPKKASLVTPPPAKELPVSGAVVTRPNDSALSIVSAVPKAPKKAVAKASELLRSGSLLWPTDGLIYSTFGASRGRRGHGAIDIVTKKGTPIAAAAAGTVAVAANGGKLFSGYGKIVILDHGEGIHTVYAHCDKLLVKIGQRVKAGEYVGTVGRTGRATTDHCHFEVRIAGKKVDPLKFLPSRPEMVKSTNWKSPSAKKKVN